eukprot:4743155-Prymnesium_polylepis.1
MAVATPLATLTAVIVVMMGVLPCMFPACPGHGNAGLALVLALVQAQFGLTRSSVFAIYLSMVPHVVTAL